MTPQELKNSILQLAIQGKLVEQRPEEGTAAKLMEKILATKNAKSAKKNLTRSRGARGEKKTSALSASPREKIPDDEKPFDIPESWEWVRLEDLVIKEIKRGKSPTYAQKSGTLVFAQKCNTKAGVINLSLALFLDETKLSKYPESEFMKDSDIVINSTGNGTLGRVGIYHDSDNPNKLPVVPDSHVTVIRVGENVSVGYVFYGLKHYQPLLEKLCSGSTNQTELSATTVKSLLFPLPPLAEQKRIVAKIEELLPLIDRYEKAWSKLEDFNRRFPVDMQKSVLQMAIQGKLVAQCPEEGTGEELYRQIQAEKRRLVKSGKLKKEKPLPEITEDEIPFEIPDSWKWVRLANIWSVLNGDRGKNYPAKSTLSHKGIPFISAINLDGKSVVKDDNLLCLSDVQYERLGNGKLVRGDVVVCIRGSLGKHGRYPFEKGAIASSLVIMRSQLELSALDDFLMLYLDTPLFFGEIKRYDNGTAQPNLAAKSLEQFLIPLPPLAEQKRIVAKLEEILSLCERLKGSVPL